MVKPPIYQRRFDEALRDFRDAHGWTQEKLSKFLGVPIGTLRGWEHTRHRPSTALEVAIRDKLQHAVT